MSVRRNKTRSRAGPRPKHEAALVRDAKAAARSAGLRYVTAGEPGFRRVRAGKRFRYVQADGAAVTDERQLERFRFLAIPPAWTDVWICATSRGHIQATGRDARGRKQYRYHPEWRRIRDRAKYEDILLFAAALPRLRQAIRRDLRARSLTKRKVIATALRVMESTRIRVGNDCYATENRSYGLTTLLDRHVKIRRGRVELRFRGKGGAPIRGSITDRRIAQLVRECRDVPGPRLFQYIAPDGRHRPITSADVNRYIQEVTGHRFTAKQFRTWSATVIATQLLFRAERPRSGAHGKREIKGAVAIVAERLGHTPAICRKCYVHPDVVEAYLDGTLHAEYSASVRDSERRSTDGLRAHESAVLRLFARLERRRRAA